MQGISPFARKFSQSKILVGAKELQDQVNQINKNNKNYCVKNKGVFHFKVTIIISDLKVGIGTIKEFHFIIAAGGKGSC